MSYCLRSWFRSTNWRASPRWVLIGVSRGRPSGHVVGLGDGRVDLGDVGGGPGVLVLDVALEGVGAAAEEQGLQRSLRGVRLARGLRLRLGDPVGDQGVDVLVVVVEPLGVVEDEVAVDQVVEDQGPLLALGVGLVLDLDVVIVALVDPGDGRPRSVVGVARRLADAPVERPASRSSGSGTNAIMQRPSGMPAQAACQIEPSTVAASARTVARRAGSPPWSPGRRSGRTRSGTSRGCCRPSPRRRPGRSPRRSACVRRTRSTASLATTGLTVPSATDGQEEDRPSRRAGPGPASASRSSTIAAAAGSSCVSVIALARASTWRSRRSGS